MNNPLLVLLLLTTGLATVSSGIRALIATIRLRRLRREHEQMIARYYNLLDTHRSLILDYDELMKADDK